MDKPPLQEGELVRMGTAFHDRSKPISAHFREDPMDDIEDCDWSKLAYVRGPHYLGDQGHHAKVQARHDQSSNIKFLEHRHDHPLNLLPELLEKDHRKAIRSRGRVRLHLHYCPCHLFRQEREGELRILYGRDPGPRWLEVNMHGYPRPGACREELLIKGVDVG